MNQVTLDSTNNHIQVSGEINFSVVTKLRDAGLGLIQQQKDCIVDFSGVTKSDSSALALLTSWARFAMKNNKPIHFVNVSAELLDLAKACDLEKILSLN